MYWSFSFAEFGFNLGIREAEPISPLAIDEVWSKGEKMVKWNEVAACATKSTVTS